MRARNIKPNFFKNELLGNEDPICSLLFIGLWCMADRDGKLEDRPLRIKAEIFPYRENLDINGCLTVIERLGFILRYKVDGKPYILIPAFKKHQHPHNTERKSEIPFPQQLNYNNGYLTVKQPLDNCYKPSESLNMNHESMNHESMNLSDSEKRRIIGEWLEQFWNIYPKKIKKALVEQIFFDKFFNIHSIDQMVLLQNTIMDAVEKQKPHWKEPEYIPGPDKWLIDERWKDEITKPKTAEEKEKEFIERMKLSLNE